MVSTMVFLVLFVPGFTACAEFGSYAFVHPVIRRLDPRDHLMVEKGLLKTFGRVMPVLMPVSLVIEIVYLSLVRPGGTAALVALAGVVVWGIGLVTTVIVNVGINLSTATWDPDRPPTDWKRTRDRWELFQALRSWAFLISFGFICLAVSMT